MAGPPQVGDLGAIALERLAITVKLVAVELDDEVGRRPVTVDQVTVDEHVDLRLGAVHVADEIEIKPLEL